MAWVPGVVICFVSFYIPLFSTHVVEFVVESLQANSHLVNSEWGSGFVVGEQGYQGFVISVYLERISETVQVHLVSEHAPLKLLISSLGVRLHRLAWVILLHGDCQALGPASVLSLVFRCGSKYAITVAPESIALTCSNALWHSGVH